MHLFDACKLGMGYKPDAQDLPAGLGQWQRLHFITLLSTTSTRTITGTLLFGCRQRG
jgi:hypothetical protein